MHHIILILHPTSLKAPSYYTAKCSRDLESWDCVLPCLSGTCPLRIEWSFNGCHGPPQGHYPGTAFTVPTSECQHLGLRATWLKHGDVSPSVLSKTCVISGVLSRVVGFSFGWGSACCCRLAGKHCWHLNTHNTALGAEAPGLQWHSPFVGSVPLLRAHVLYRKLGKYAHLKELCSQDNKMNDNHEAMIQIH